MGKRWGQKRPGEGNIVRTQRRGTMTTQLERIAVLAKTKPKQVFTSLAHLLTVEFLVETWKQLNQRGAAGLDGETTKAFESNLRPRCQNLVERLKAGRYRPMPVRRVDIPKGDGKTRPLGIATVEDRLVQRAVARILGAIYEQDFLPCSYGFRPTRGAHDAVRELRNQFMAGMVTTVFETDIRGFFDHLNHQWLLRMLKVRVADTKILRLICRWLKAGAMVNGLLVRSEEGSPQGGPISPLLANVYLHYALDLWFQKRYIKEVRGNAYLTRYADDFVAAFQYGTEAAKFEVAVKERLKQFNLELAENKTNRIRFGRLPSMQGKETGTFVFLGFQHVAGRDRQGRFAVIRLPAQKSCSRFLDTVKTELRKKPHARGPDQQWMLLRKLRGFYHYYGLNGCLSRLNRVRFNILYAWRKAIRRQGQRSKAQWFRLNRHNWFDLPYPTVLHPNV